MRIEDILVAIAKIDDFTKRLDLAQFRASPMTMDAVFYNLMIIGEAARFIPLDVEQCYPSIDWAQMRGMRNVLVHEYFGADLGIVWETVRNDLPRLADELREVQRREG